LTGVVVLWSSGSDLCSCIRRVAGIRGTCDCCYEASTERTAKITWPRLQQRSTYETQRYTQSVMNMPVMT